MNKKLWIICIILVILAVIIGSFALLYKEPGETKQSEPIVKQIKLTDFVSEEEAKSWQTYKDDEFGFEFRYPKGWNVHIGDYYTNKKIIGLNPNGVEGGSQIMLEVHFVDCRASEDYFCINYNGFVKGMLYSVPLSGWDVSLNGFSGKMFDISNPSNDKLFSKSFFFKEGENFFSFQTSRLRENLFYPIFSTFKFYNSSLNKNRTNILKRTIGFDWIPSNFVGSGIFNKTNNWKVYKDDEFGFQINIPREWITEREDDRVIFYGDSAVYQQINQKCADTPLSINIKKTSVKDAHEYIMKDYLGDYLKLNPKFSYSEVEKKYVKINGENWLLYNDDIYYDLDGGRALVFIKNGFSFNVHFSGCILPYSDQLFVDIISTFKFTK